MTTTNLFEYATREQLRFESPQGELSVEQLWQLPLTSANSNKANLNDIGLNIRAQLKKLDDADSLVSDGPTTAMTLKAVALQAKFDIIKHIIAVKKAEGVAAANERVRAEKRQTLLELKAKRQAEGLASMSEAEIDAELAALS